MNNSCSIFSPEFSQKVFTDLEQGKLVRYKFSEWGRMHIDRQLPFVCIYRRPRMKNDDGSERLLLGQASYIMITEEEADTSDFKNFLKALCWKSFKDFGASLVFEIWSDESNESTLEKLAPANFNIKVRKQNAPHKMLEELESALIEFSFENRQSRVELDYNEQCRPLMLSPLLSDTHFYYHESYWLGLSVTPIYRQDGELLPYVLRKLHKCLTHALKRSFYTFTHSYTAHKPAHFHELGRRAITNSVWTTDQQLAEIKDQFDMLLHVTPVNCEEAWLDFQEHKFTKPPVFNYRPRPIDPDILKQRLYDIPLKRIEDPTLWYLFQTQRDEIDRQLTMINDSNKRNFLFGSMQVYGDVQPGLLQLAEKF